MTEVSRILAAIAQGDPRAAEQLLPMVYDELRRLAAQKLAQEKPGQTFQATALAHEMYIRLPDSERGQDWNSWGHFFAAAVLHPAHIQALTMSTNKSSVRLDFAVVAQVEH